MEMEMEMESKLLLSNIMKQNIFGSVVLTNY